MADPGPQLSKVLDFRKQLEQMNNLRYRSFNDEQQFVREVDQHLRAYAKGALPPVDTERDIVVFPVESLRELERSKEKAAEGRRRHAQRRFHTSVPGSRLTGDDLAATVVQHVVGLLRGRRR